MTVYTRSGTAAQRAAALQREADAAERELEARIKATRNRIAAVEREHARNLAAMEARLEARRMEVRRLRGKIKKRRIVYENLLDRINRAIAEGERRYTVLTAQPEPVHGGRAGLAAATRELMEHEKKKRLSAGQNNL